MSSSSQIVVNDRTSVEFCHKLKTMSIPEDKLTVMMMVVFGKCTKSFTK